MSPYHLRMCFLIDQEIVLNVKIAQEKLECTELTYIFVIFVPSNSSGLHGFACQKMD